MIDFLLKNIDEMISNIFAYLGFLSDSNVVYKVERTVQSEAVDSRYMLLIMEVYYLKIEIVGSV